MFQEYFKQLNNLNESYPLEEVFETHEELNPRLFQDNYLKPEIREQLLKIVDEFISHLKEDNIPLDVIDYWLLGSNAQYNYSPHSDIDIHIIVNMENLGVDPYILQVLYNYIKSDFNKKYNIEVKGHEVELYIEDVRSGAVTNGIYSLLKDKWVKEPIKTEYMYFDVTETDEYKDWYQRYLNLEDSEIDQFINDLYLMRKESLIKDGEWSTGNLIFKEFRNHGYLNDLKERKYKFKSDMLTLEGLNEDLTLSDDKIKESTHFKDQALNHIKYFKNTLSEIDDGVQSVFNTLNIEINDKLEKLYNYSYKNSDDPIGNISKHLEYVFEFSKKAQLKVQDIHQKLKDVESRAFKPFEELSTRDKAIMLFESLNVNFLTEATTPQYRDILIQLLKLFATENKDLQDLLDSGVPLNFHHYDSDYENYTTKSGNQAKSKKARNNHPSNVLIMSEENHKKIPKRNRDGSNIAEIMKKADELLEKNKAFRLSDCFNKAVANILAKRLREDQLL